MHRAGPTGAYPKRHLLDARLRPLPWIEVGQLHCFIAQQSTFTYFIAAQRSECIACASAFVD